MADLRIGITGSGSTSRTNVVALVEDYLSKHADDRVTFVLDCTPGEGAVPGFLSPAVSTVAAWATTEEYPVELLLPTGGDDGLPKSLLASAERQTRVASPPVAVVRNCDVVLIAWDAEDDTAMRALLTADKWGVPAFDLTDGLLPLAFDDAEGTGTDAPPSGPDPVTGTQDQESAERPTEEPSSVGSVPEKAILSPADLDRLAQAVAACVIEAIKPLLPVKRGPGRPRKTPVQE